MDIPAGAWFGLEVSDIEASHKIIVYAICQGWTDEDGKLYAGMDLPSVFSYCDEDDNAECEAVLLFTAADAEQFLNDICPIDYAILWTFDGYGMFPIEDID